MLAIRLKRTGRKAYATYRIAVQEANRHPSSGRVVAYVGSYNPHTKDATINKELATKYLNNGAQPTGRVARLLKEAGVVLPGWVKEASVKTRSTRNPDKLRKNQPKEEPAEAPAETEAPVEEAASADENAEA